MNKAQAEFRSRYHTDSRAFATWYDNEDVQRLIWQIYQNIPSDKKHHFLRPYVFYDNMEKNKATTLDKLLDVCHQLLREHNLKYLPFILKPKIHPHFYAGFIHINPDYIYIFDPLGSTLNNVKFRDCFQVSRSNQIGDLRVIVSSEHIQNTVYEEELVSCGPLCVEFIDYIMTHPEVVPDSNFPNSIMPPQFAELMQSSLELYQTSIVTIREKHDRYLSQLSDEQLTSSEFEGFYQDITSALLYLETEEEKNAVSEFQPSALTVNYHAEDVKHIIQQIYQNVSPKMQQCFSQPHIFDTNTLDLDSELSARYRILREKNLNYFPFLFKPKSSEHFYAGLVLRNPNSVYLFIPNGVIPVNEKLEVHLGLSSKFFIGNLPLVVSPQAQPRLPNNRNVCTLLSIEFLDYIMNHEKTFEKPHKFLELLKIHGYDFQTHINSLCKKQEKHLVRLRLLTQSPINNTQQTYLHYLSELTQVVREVEQTCNHHHPSQVLKLAVSEARNVLSELRSRLPVNPEQNNLLPTTARLDDALLLRLTDLCSHVTHGLIFISQNQVPRHAHIFSYKGGSSGKLCNLHYDLAVHQENMAHITESALLLPGAGWHRLKKALFILAGAMVLICGMLVAASSSPISAGLLLTLAGTATLSTGIGFFVGQDTGLASAAKKVKMQTSHNDSIHIFAN